MRAGRAAEEGLSRDRFETALIGEPRDQAVLVPNLASVSIRPKLQRFVECLFVGFGFGPVGQSDVPSVVETI
jgi:hypothetical protein